MNSTKNTIIVMPVLAGLLLIFSSCVNTRKVTYFNDINEKSVAAASVIPESVIQKNDLLSISVSSLSESASAIFNTPNTSSLLPGSSVNQASGYLVNTDGNIQFPILGSIQAAGLTKDQLNQSITKRLLQKQLLVDPIVNIRFLNFRVTVLGEVKNPAVLSVPSEKISLLEALGLAGDLTIYGKRDNVLIIREEIGKPKTFKRINLNTDELFSSPYYYLKSNDIVYVEPNKARVSSSSQAQQWLPLVVSGLSLAIIIADRLIK